MRIHVGSLGCKLNQSEMDDLAGRLALAGHEIVATPAEAELCVLNTCAVTHVAAQKSRQALGRLHRANPAARLVAAGCYAELAPAELAALPGVELVAGNRDKDRLAELLAPAPAAPPAARAARPRTRALIKIQDGCDNVCTYCIVRVARGPQWSRPAADVLAAAHARLRDGYRELVLTGVHIGAYGRDRSSAAAGGLDLCGLVGRLLAETPLERLRLSSIEPWDLPERALALWSDPRLCRHLHLPLQSGSDVVLSRMARRYTTAQFAALVALARAAIPGVAITTDVIVGFPGESEAEFAAGLAFVQNLDLARVHVFPFSPRAGTAAARLPGQVPAEVKAARAQAMRTVAAAGERAFRARFVGQTLPVLWETSRPGEGGRVWNGLTDNYLRVHAPSAAERANTIAPARLVAVGDEGLRGVLDE